jgi:hypothetical protein
MHIPTVEIGPALSVNHCRLARSPLNSTRRSLALNPIGFNHPSTGTRYRNGGHSLPASSHCTPALIGTLGPWSGMVGKRNMPTHALDDPQAEDVRR